jgi:hypothetical protein
MGLWGLGDSVPGTHLEMIMNPQATCMHQAPIKKEPWATTAIMSETLEHQFGHTWLAFGSWHIPEFFSSHTSSLPCPEPTLSYPILFSQEMLHVYFFVHFIRMCAMLLNDLFNVFLPLFLLGYV